MTPAFTATNLVLSATQTNYYPKDEIMEKIHFATPLDMERTGAAGRDLDRLNAGMGMVNIPAGGCGRKSFGGVFASPAISSVTCKFCLKRFL